MQPEENNISKDKETLNAVEIKATLEFVRTNPLLFPLPEVVIKEKAKTEEAKQIDVKGRQIDTVKYVTFLHLPGREFALKTYGRGKGLTGREAEILVYSFKLYHAELKKSKVLIPENYLQTIIESGKDSESRIIFVDDFIGTGKNLEDYFRNNEVKDSEKLDAYQKLLRICMSLPRGASGISRLDLDVVGDFKPANFVTEDDGRIFFVDLFAPKLRDPYDGMVSPYFRQLEDLSRTVVTFLCGDVRGVIARMLGLSRRIMPKLEESLIEITRAVLKKEDPEILQFIDEQIKDKFQMIGELYSLKDEEFFKFEESLDKV